MRCDQHIGLPTEAIFFLDKMEVEPNVCHDCERPYPRDLEVIDNYYGMFNNQYNLYRHQLKDGRYADEFLQVILGVQDLAFLLVFEFMISMEMSQRNSSGMMRSLLTHDRRN